MITCPNCAHEFQLAGVRQCVRCGRTMTIYAQGLCGSCYRNHNITRSGREIECIDCGQVRRFYAKDRCVNCYKYNRLGFNSNKTTKKAYHEALRKSMETSEVAHQKLLKKVFGL